MKAKKHPFRFGLLTLLACPVCFAIGWYARGLQHSSNVEDAVEKVVRDTGGFLDPDTGLLFGKSIAVDAVSQRQSESPVITDRRENLLNRMVEDGKLEESESGLLVVPDQLRDD